MARRKSSSLVTAIAVAAILMAAVQSCGGARQAAALKPPGSLAFSDPRRACEAAELWRQQQAGSSDPATYAALGKILLLEGYVSEAVAYTELGLAASPQDVGLHLVLATALQRPPANDTPRAARILREAVRLAPSNAKAYLHLGYAYDRAGLANQSLAAFEKSLALSNDPGTRLSAHMGLLAASRKKGDELAAESHMKAIREIYPGIDDDLLRLEIQNRGPQLENAGGMEAESSATHPAFDKRLAAVMERIKQTSEGAGGDGC